MKIFLNRQKYFSEPDCSDVALLLGAVLQEGVHQLGVNQVPSPKTIKDSMSAVMSDAAEHSETGDQHSVVVVTK